MRRFFLMLTVLSVPGWSQHAQLPIVVQVQMPPTNPWVHIVDLVVPGIIGAGIALLGVWLTNKTNEKTNALARKHQQELERIKDEIAAEAKSRDNRWAFRKQVYSDLVRTICKLSNLFNEGLSLSRSYQTALVNPAEMQAWVVKLQDFDPRVRDAVSEFFILANQSRLSTADWVSIDILKTTPILRHQMEFDLRSPEFSDNMKVVIEQLNSLLKTVCEAGRKDLWETEPTVTPGIPKS